jgi:hypothetical protein
MSIETILQMQKLGEMSKSFTQELINFKASIDNQLLTENAEHIQQLLTIYNIVFNDFQKIKDLKIMKEYLNSVEHHLCEICTHDYVTDEIDIHDHVLVLTYCQICKISK